MKKNMNKGFSLVELIIVIAIMAVLIGILAPQYIKYVEKSKQSTDVDNVQAIKTAIEAAAASEEITSGSITVTGGASGTISYTVAGSTTTLDGVAASAKLKSSGWGSQTYTYNFTTYTWGTPGSCANTKNPKMDMQSVFE